MEFFKLADNLNAQFDQTQRTDSIEEAVIQEYLTSIALSKTRLLAHDDLN